MGFAASYSAFALLFFLLLVIRAAGWPALAKLIGLWIPPDGYGRAWGILSTSSRVSVVLSSWAIGGLLLFSDWRGVFISVGLFAALAALGLSRVFPHSPGTAVSEVAEKTRALEVLATFRRFARADRFWLICASVMCTTLLMGLIDFMPLYLRETFNVSISKAAMASSVFPFGCLVSVLIAGIFYDRLSRKQRIYAIASSLAIGCLCIAMLALITTSADGQNTHFDVALVLILLLGVSVAPAYYLPMSVFSVEFGGKRSGVLVGLIDAAGYSAAAVFGFLGGALADQQGGWALFLWVLFAISCGALVTTATFLYRDHRLQDAR